MSLLVTGSIGIDTVSTPHGQAEEVLGGSAVYFALAASHYVPVRLVAAIGNDFPPGFRRVLESRPIDLSGLEVRPHSRTFRWTGRFDGDMNEAQTLDVQLNVLGEEAPRVPQQFHDSRAVFLANTHPTAQRDVLKQLDTPDLVVCDSMNHWITTERESLVQTLRLVTGVIINDQEARELAGCANLIEAGEAIRALGPRFVMVKKGEHGALLFTDDGVFPLPGYPHKVVRDPTGAGDSFAGGIMGYLAAEGRHDTATLRRAMVQGTVAASFAIEDFSVRAVENLTRDDVDRRVDEYVSLLQLT